jgi:iron complex transport system ATP-binding protein
MNDCGTLMDIRRLSIGYAAGKREALFHNISASIFRGNLIALFGRNGIGKSTLLRTMARLQLPVAGTVALLGQDLQKWKQADIAKQIAFVPSQPLRTQNLSVLDMVGTGRYGFTNRIGSEQESDKKAVARALEATSMSHLARRDSSTLSDGELQRASIARSLAQDTPLIFLDEPTAFLDTGNKYKTVSLLKDLTQKENKGILFSTHDLTLALQVCDILWIMEENGFHAAPPVQLIQQGVLDALFNSDGLAFDHKALSYKFDRAFF